jgi:hypothetical protein
LSRARKHARTAPSRLSGRTVLLFSQLLGINITVMVTLSAMLLIIRLDGANIRGDQVVLLRGGDIWGTIQRARLPVLDSHRVRSGSGRPAPGLDRRRREERAAHR